MGYTNSPLVAYTKLSPNHSGQRTHSIDRISPHCVVGQCTAESLGDWFAKESTQASSNYGIDKNGRVGMYVEEKNRSWCTSSNSNDQRAVTIEVASDAKHPYAMKNAAYNSLIDLCVDICKRNGKTKLIWFGDKNKALQYKPVPNEMIITVHRWFANKSCPGEWLYSRLGDLADKVTAKLSGTTENKKEEPKEEPKPEVTSNIKKGDVVKIKSGAKYYNGKDVPTWVRNKTWIVKECVGDRAVIDKSADGKNAICSPINVQYLTVVESAKQGAFSQYKVKVSINDLNIRKGPGTNYGTNGVVPVGIYTIIAEASGQGATKWGKLKSGAGWISLDYAKKI